MGVEWRLSPVDSYTGALACRSVPRGSCGGTQRWSARLVSTGTDRKGKGCVLGVPTSLQACQLRGNRHHPANVRCTGSYLRAAAAASEDRARGDVPDNLLPCLEAPSGALSLCTLGWHLAPCCQCADVDTDTCRAVIQPCIVTRVWMYQEHCTGVNERPPLLLNCYGCAKSRKLQGVESAL